MKNQITYWSETGTIASTAAISVGLGGTGSNLSAVPTGGLIYKSGATTLAGTGPLTGVLKGDGAGIPTAITGTKNQITYWSETGTIASTSAISVGLGGTGADLSGAAGIGGLIYKNTATTLAGTGPLTGVLKGNGTGIPTAITGMKNQITYWSETGTIASTAAISVGLGGTGSNLSAVPTGGLIYKSGATTLAGTGLLTGVLKGNGSSPPTGNATQADVGPGGGYEQYDQENVDISGGSIGGTTILGSYNRTIAELRAITPTAMGEVYFCTDCAPPKVVVSTGTALRNFADALGGQFQ
jgi:hypothetical protein